MKKILVAIDLSDIAIAAVEYAAKLAVAFNSQVRILHVEVPIPAYIGNELVQPVIPTDNDEELIRIRKDLSAMVDHLNLQGIEADYELVKGPIVETIIEKAALYSADIILLGAHNHGFLYRAFIGSVCSGVVKHSPCPVLIIPSK
ncbi:MAG: universal stress protein [Bacteroidota bacterium]